MWLGAGELVSGLPAASHQAHALHCLLFDIHASQCHQVARCHAHECYGAPVTTGKTLVNLHHTRRNRHLGALGIRKPQSLQHCPTRT